MGREFIPDGFKPDEETEQLAEQIRLLEASCSRTTPKPTQPRPVRPFDYEPVAPRQMISRNASIHLDEDEGARRLNGGVRSKQRRT